MGIIVNKNDDKSELNQRITADLRERAVRNSAKNDPDLVEDSDYTSGMKKTGSFGWIWIVLIILAIISLAVIVLI